MLHFPLPRRAFVAACLALALVLAALVAASGSSTASQRTSALSTAQPVKARAAQSAVPADQRYPVGGPAMQAATTVAVQQWGANPCGGTYTLQWTAGNPTLNAWASWLNPTDAWNNPTQNNTCKIDLNPNVFWDFPKLCTVLAHEIGHLLGHNHDPNPNGLMSAMYSQPLPACIAANPEPAPQVAEIAAFGEDEDDFEDADFSVEPAKKAKSSKKRKAKKKTLRKKKASSCKTRKAKRTKRCKAAAKKASSCKSRKAKRTKRCKAAAKKRRMLRARKARNARKASARKK